MNPKFRPVENNKPITKVPVLMRVGRCPQGCKEHLQISTSCYAIYVDQNADLLTAINASGSLRLRPGRL